jgi:hypothetical protein
LLLSIVPLTLQKPVSFSWIWMVIPPVELEALEALEALELLDDEELLELDELLLDEELELLLDELEELDELLLDEDELLEEPPSPTQAGAIKLPSWLPCTPTTLLAVAPGAGNCQPQQLLNWKLVPVPGVQPAFQALVTETCSGKFNVMVQPLSAVVPVLVTLRSNWKNVPPVLDGVAVQL